jgi:hypothetical protein
LWLIGILMPRAYDRRQLSLSHDPSKRISEELPKTPPFTGPTQFAPTGDIPIPIVQDLIDSIIKGFTAWSGQTGFDTANVQDFSNTVAQAIGTIGTIGLRVQKLENGGAIVFEDFATYANAVTLGAEWLQWEQGTGQGTLGIINKYAQYNLALDNVNRSAFALHKTSAPNALHRVSATISTPQDVFGQSENFLIARANLNSATDYVFAAMTWTKVRIGYVKAGTTTIITSRDYLFKNGSAYSLDCTTAGTLRLLENTNEILSASDAGAPTGQYTGFATFAPNGAARPGVLGSFAVYDN